MSREIDFNEHKCLICGQHCMNRRSLGNHLTKSHGKMRIKDYVLKFYCNGILPKCLCGCGEDVAWKKTHYYFNDYINGHNPAGFKAEKYNHSKEVIEKRNKSIRNVYIERSEEISEKISQSVTEAFQRPEVKENLLKGQQRYWSTPESRINTSRIRKKQWADHYDSIYEKIFTPQFRLNTSLRNMQREMKRTSKAEKHFLDQLEQILVKQNLSLVRSKWLKLGNLTKCCDGYIPEHNAIVEFDGIFWHGLDRDSDFSYQQVINMGKDLFVNRIARDEKMTLIRVQERTSLDSVTTFSELCEVAYHLVIAGEVKREGSKKLDLSCLIDEETRALFAAPTQLIKLNKHLDNLIEQHANYWGMSYCFKA